MGKHEGPFLRGKQAGGRFAEQNPESHLGAPTEGTDETCCTRTEARRFDVVRVSNLYITVFCQNSNFPLAHTIFSFDVSGICANLPAYWQISAADCAWAPFLERYAAQLPLLHSGLRPYDA